MSGGGAGGRWVLDGGVAGRYHRSWQAKGALMAIRGDSNGLERAYLLDMLPREIGRVLEIGCGDGRLTRKYAEKAAGVVGIDLPSGLSRGSASDVADVMELAAASGVALPFHAESFDQAIFSLSF